MVADDKELSSLRRAVTELEAKVDDLDLEDLKRRIDELERRVDLILTAGVNATASTIGTLRVQETRTERGVR